MADYYFRTWSKRPTGKRSVLDMVCEELVMSERVINGRNPEASMIIVDSRSAKNTFTAEESGFDGGKKYRGLKYMLEWIPLGFPTAFL
jgi:hypothetical protein